MLVRFVTTRTGTGPSVLYDQAATILETGLLREPLVWTSNTSVSPIRFASVPYRDDIYAVVIVDDAIDDPVIAGSYAEQVVRSAEFACACGPRIDRDLFDSSKDSPRSLHRKPFELTPCRPR